MKSAVAKEEDRPMGLIETDYPITSDVRVALCETNGTLRSAFQTALYRRGLRAAEVCRDSGALLSLLETQVVDLVICSADLPGIDFPYLVQQIRRQTIGKNPFTLILATVADATLDEIREIINAGVDRVARKPISMGDMMAYVNALTSTRKPFVATESYVGPSRRAGARPEGEGTVMEVPNTLRAKLLERGTPADLSRLIGDSMDGLRQMREQNSTLAVYRSVRRISRLLTMPEQFDRVGEEFPRLLTLCEAVEARFRGSENDHFAEIARCMAQLVELLRRLPEDSLASQAVTLSLMEQLGEVFRQTGKCDPETVAFAQQITAAVKKFLVSMS
jgi:DNA-binding response OmpR family regulator